MFVRDNGTIVLTSNEGKGISTETWKDKAYNAWAYAKNVGAKVGKAADSLGDASERAAGILERIWSFFERVWLIAMEMLTFVYVLLMVIIMGLFLAMIIKNAG